MMCKIMDTVTYPDPSVRDELTRHWVEVELDTATAAAVHEMFHVAAIPTAVAATGDGTIRGRVEGFVEPARLRAELAAFRTDR
jgi:hypothetical protein